MGIVIDGLEMPKENERLEIVINSNGKVTYSLDLDCKQIAIAHSPKVGHWVKDKSGEPIGTYCSECGWSWVNGVAAVNLNKALSLIKTPRCPWCGAKMDEVEE